MIGFLDTNGLKEIKMTRQWGDPVVEAASQMLKQDNEFALKPFNSNSQLLIFNQDGKDVNRACIIVGSLAIHDDLIDPQYFQISHVPTRADFMSAVPTTDDQAYSDEQLISWCKAVQSRYQEHWEKINRLTPQNYRTEWSNVADDLRQLREWCLSWEI